MSTSRPSEGRESVDDDDDDDHDDVDDWTKLCPTKAARTRCNHMIGSFPGVKTAKTRMFAHTL